MATGLERRIGVLEQVDAPGDGITVIATQIVSPGNLEPEYRCCRIEEVTYTCGADERPADFDARMMGVAEGLNRRLGRPIRVYCSETDLNL